MKPARHSLHTEKPSGIFVPNFSLRWSADSVVPSGGADALKRVRPALRAKVAPNALPLAPERPTSIAAASGNPSEKVMCLVDSKICHVGLTQSSMPRLGCTLLGPMRPMVVLLPRAFRLQT